MPWMQPQTHHVGSSCCGSSTVCALADPRLLAGLPALPCALGVAQVALDVQHHHTMAALQHRVNSREQIVGWFSTGDPDASRSRDALIHSFYGNECPNPVHLALDTSGQGGTMSVRAFVSCALSIGGRELAREFSEVDCEVRSTEAERVGVDLLRWVPGVAGRRWQTCACACSSASRWSCAASTQVCALAAPAMRLPAAERYARPLLPCCSTELQEKLPGDMEGLADSFERLQQSLQQAQDYVDAVVVSALKGACLEPPAPLIGAADYNSAADHFSLCCASAALCVRRRASGRATPQLGDTWQRRWRRCRTLGGRSLSAC